MRHHVVQFPGDPGPLLHSGQGHLPVTLGLRVLGSRDRIDRVLRAINLSGRADACGALSKGLRQRVALAGALLSDPEVLFLDEPTVGLDPVAARDVHELIAALRESGVTIFLTTHRLEEAERLCDRVAILNTTLRTIGRPLVPHRPLSAASRPPASIEAGRRTGK